MNIIRLYKLQKLGIEIGESETKILNYLNIVFNNLKSISLKNHIDELIFINKKNEFIFCLVQEKIIFIQQERVWNDMRLLLKMLELNDELTNLQQIFREYVNFKFSMSATNAHIISKFDYESMVF